MYWLCGQRGGDIVSEIYRLQLKNHERSSHTGYEAFRNPEYLTADMKEVCIVIPSYPLSMANIHPASLKMAWGQIQEKVCFDALKNNSVHFKLDKVDAFFLPFSPLGDVIRPGPNIEILMIKGPKKEGNLGYLSAIDLWSEDLRKARPKFIIDSHRGHFFYGAYPLTRYPEVWNFIEDNYRLVTVIGNYNIYEWAGR